MTHKMLLTTSLFALSLYFVTQLVQSAFKSCSCDLPDSDFAAGVSLVYYKCNNETPATIAYPITAPQGLLEVLEEKRTIFYVFGYNEKPEDDNVQIIIQALCYGRTDNVVLLDWSKYSIGLYPVVFERAQNVGRLFAHSLQLLKENNFDVSTIYLIGHSLGSHIVGFAGKCNDFVIPRITGLDPANSLFYPFGCYLKPSDATWVDCIHTDRGVFGTFRSLGTAEYYANGGCRPQPGCNTTFAIPLSSEDLCSHQKSVTIYAESKYRANLIAVQCDSYAHYEANKCNNNLHTGVGYAASNVNGSFYFSTAPSTAKKLLFCYL